MEYGYAPSSEEHGPNELVENARKSEEHGFEFAGRRLPMHRIWPNAALGGDLGYELPLPRHFEEATENVTAAELKEKLPVGPDGRDQDGFFASGGRAPAAPLAMRSGSVSEP